MVHAWPLARHTVQRTLNQLISMGNTGSQGSNAMAGMADPTATRCDGCQLAKANLT